MLSYQTRMSCTSVVVSYSEIFLPNALPCTSINIHITNDLQWTIGALMRRRCREGPGREGGGTLGVQALDPLINTVQSIEPLAKSVNSSILHAWAA